jgi:hypothetical protein
MVVPKEFYNASISSVQQTQKKNLKTLIYFSLLNWLFLFSFHLDALENW